MSSPWVAYMVVGLAVSMIGILGVGIISLTNTNVAVDVSDEGKNTDV